MNKIKIFEGFTKQSRRKAMTVTVVINNSSNENKNPRKMDTEAEKSTSPRNLCELRKKLSEVSDVLELVKREKINFTFPGLILIPFENGTVFLYLLEDIDVKSCSMGQSQINERLICDVSMSYLSTLGGAYSSLGDDFLPCAKRAGEISMEQFKIALRLQEAPMLARCCIYLALSFIQRGKYKDAQKMIIEQYKTSKILHDERLKKMCLGVWAKLRYAKQNVPGT